MKKWLYVASIAVIVAVWIFYFISTRSLIAELTDNQTVLTNSLNDTQTKYAALQAQYDAIEHYDVELNNPTYEQVKVALSELKSVKIDGNCLDRTKYVQDYFHDKGLQCYVVTSNYKGGFGHSTVAFYTEKGWIYVEPDGMAEIKIAEGLPYYIPNRVYDGPVGMTAKDFIEKNTVIQLVKMR